MDDRTFVDKSLADKLLSMRKFLIPSLGPDVFAAAHEKAGMLPVRLLSNGRPTPCLVSCGFCVDRITLRGFFELRLRSGVAAASRRPPSPPPKLQLTPMLLRPQRRRRGMRQRVIAM